MSYYRTPEHRAKQAERIRDTKPWQKSTGPISLDGKARSSRNSKKHGLFSQAAKDERRLLRSFIQRCANVNGSVLPCAPVRSIKNQ